MPLKASDWGEVERIIRTNRALLLVVYDSGKHEQRYMRMFLRSIEPAFEPEVPIIYMDLRDLDENKRNEILSRLRIGASDLPLLRLYYNGDMLWSQFGLFYSLSVDREAMRRGIWVALEKWGLKPLDLGLKLARLRNY